MSAGGTDFDINRRRCLSLPRALGRLARGSAAMALGDLLDPADLDVGDLVQAREPPAVVWYNAKVIAKEGAGVTIHYTGYPTSHDKTFEADDEAIREKISAQALRLERKGLSWGGSTVGLQPDGTYAAETIIKKQKLRKRWRYLVRWQGWGPEWDSWSYDVSGDIKLKFERTQARANKGAPTPAPKPPPAPFSDEVTIEDTALEVWVEAARDILGLVQDEAGEKARNQKMPAAARVVQAREPADIL